MQSRIGCVVVLERGDLKAQSIVAVRLTQTRRLQRKELDRPANAVRSGLQIGYRYQYRRSLLPDIAFWLHVTSNAVFLGCRLPDTSNR